MTPPLARVRYVGAAPIHLNGRLIEPGQEVQATETALRRLIDRTDFTEARRPASRRPKKK